jgi:hypothetical protein
LCLFVTLVLTLVKVAYGASSYRRSSCSMSAGPYSGLHMKQSSMRYKVAAIFREIAASCYAGPWIRVLLAMSATLELVFMIFDPAEAVPTADRSAAVNFASRLGEPLAQIGIYQMAANE